MKIALQDDRAELQDLLVREVTRRRGVGLTGAGCSVSCRRLPTGSCRPPARRRANAGKSITSCAPAASHRRAISGKNETPAGGAGLDCAGAGGRTPRAPAATRPASGWDQQVYVWQRVWTPLHADALTHSRDLFGALRAGAAGASARRLEIPADLSLLKQDGRPLWLVARLDGQLPQLDQEAIIQRLLALTQRWQAAGLPVTGVEIDHAATARLPDYQRFLQRLPTAAHRFATGITALPTGSARPTCPAYCNRPTVPSCRCTRCSRRSRGCLTAPWHCTACSTPPSHRKPFRVALPAYGMALLGFDAQGAQVESESSLRVAGNGRELTVAPQQIADFLQTLAQQTPPRLRGIIWFRLPLADDRRAGRSPRCER